MDMSMAATMVQMSGVKKAEGTVGLLVEVKALRKAP
jgi:hypothetical protein